MTAGCALCGSGHSRALFRGEDRLHGQPVRAEVRRCDECGLVYLWPQPGRPQDHYPADYAAYVGSDHSTGIAFGPGHRAGLRRKARLVGQYPQGTLLDVGCASGEFLVAVRRLAPRALLGMDISGPALERARHLELDVWQGSLPGLPLADQSVGVATLWHVLEHLPSPRAALHDLARVLRTDGVAVIACPMVDSWEARLFGRYWAGYDVPRHLFGFSRQTLPRLLREAGFAVSEVLHVVWGWNSARLSSAWWLRSFPLLRDHPRLLRAASALLGGAVALAFELLSSIFGNHRSVGVFVARKETGSA